MYGIAGTNGTRIVGAVNYNSKPDSTGYINRTIHEIVASAGWRGHGFGGGELGVPYAYTDLFPAFLISCFGWGGGLLFSGVVLWFGLKLLLNCGLRKPGTFIL